MTVDHRWALALLLLCVPALRGAGDDWKGVSALLAIPVDPISHALDIALRLVLAGIVAAIVLGLAGLHGGGREIERHGQGAHIVLLLDRSLSMDEGFAIAGAKPRLSKTEAAAQLIEDFFARRRHDSFGVIAFSTQPIPILPLTEHREAVAAAMAAMQQKGLADTDIGSGLQAALKMFENDDPAASRVILFVSDGAGRIPDAVQVPIRAQMLLQRIHLYYLYLRSGDAPALAADIAGHEDPTQPAALDAFFRSLGVPYRGFEAGDPDAVAAATRAIGGLEIRPVTYHEMVPRVGYEGLCYGLAAAGLMVLLLARLAERDFSA